MKKEILFLHSGGPQGPGEGSSRLLSWLKKTLGDAYHIKHPVVADPDNPSYVNWKKLFKKELGAAGPEVILVAHSIGGSVLLKYLSEEECKRKIAGLFMISAPYWGMKGWEYEEFYLKKDFASRLPPIPAIFLYHSRDDDAVSFSHQAKYASKLTATVHEIKGSEHEFKDGLPLLAKDIKSL